MFGGSASAANEQSADPYRVPPVRAIRRFTVRVTLPQPLAPLHDLMLNLRWSWHSPTVELFESIDPAGWAASGGDPVAMLSSMRPAQLAALAANEDFRRRLDAAVADLRDYTGEPRWYQSASARSEEHTSELQ